MEKKRNRTGAVLWQFMKGSRKWLAFSMIASGCSTILLMTRPLVIKYILDVLSGEEHPGSIPVLGSVLDAFAAGRSLQGFLILSSLCFIGITAVGGLGMFFMSYLAARAAEDTVERMRGRLYDHIQDLSYIQHSTMDTGDFIQRCTSDIDTIKTFLSTQIAEIGRALFLLVTVVSIMLTLDVRMTLISMVLIPGIFIFSYIFFRKVRRRFTETDEAEAALTTVVQEHVSGIRVVRAFARETFEMRKYDVKNRYHSDTIYRLLRLLAWYWSISDFVCLLQLSLVIILGGYWAALGIISIGTFFAFFAYVERLLWPVRQMGRILTDMGKMHVAVDRMLHILGQQSEYTVNGAETPVIRGNVEFKDVSYAYVPGHPVLDGVSLTVKQGETIAILGPTGSGKTTLMHLLTRLMEPDSGEITIDGMNIREMEKHWLRSHVGIVLQEPFLFNRTIRDNIALARITAKENEILETAAVAAVHDVICQFDKGYETPVGEGGVTLSGGQKQRIAIARILLKNPPILIFDDSLSAVDTITDEAIRSSLSRRANRATTFIIAHRVTTLAAADRIIVIEHGRITQVGTHEELIALQGLYKRIWDIQQQVETSPEKTEESGEHMYAGL